MKTLFSTIILGVLASAQLLAQTFETVATKEGISFRGMDTHKEKVIWISGSNGTVGRSLDAGKTWEWINPTGYESFDFRDIEAFGKNEAVIISAGSPTVILRTVNGGNTWHEVYRNEREDIFFNGMDFQGKTGFAIGDPIDGFFQLLKSTDKGKTWQDVTNTMYLFAEDGEVAFAASGTSIQVLGDNVWIGSGGSYAALYQRNEKQLFMYKHSAPILSGTASTGIFSISFLDDKHGIVVGGDYMNDEAHENNVLITNDGGENWTKPAEPVHGYRSCVVHIDKKNVLATGTSGTDLSNDQGNTWTNIDKASFNVITKSPSGKHIYLAGSNGNISKLVL